MSDNLKAWERSNVVAKSPVDIEEEKYGNAKEIQRVARKYKEDADLRIARAIEAQKRLDNDYIKNGKKLVDNSTGENKIIDKDNKITTRSNDAKEVKAIVDMVETKGWTKIDVEGSTKFKQALWAEAATRGIETRGHKPSQDEIDAVEARIAKNEKEIESKKNKELNGNDQGASNGRKKHSTSNEKEQELLNKRVTLVDHGEAPFEFKKNNTPNYYVTLNIEGTEKTVWGKGIEKAVRESGAVKGEEVMLRRTGERPVTITDKKTGEKKDVMRGDWEMTRDKDIVIAENAAKALISAAGLSSKQMDKASVGLDDALTRAQANNSVPTVSLYDKDEKVIEDAKQKQNRERPIVESPSQEISPSHSHSL